MSIGSLRGPKRTGSWLWTHKPWVLPRSAAMHTGWPSAQASSPSAKCRVRVWLSAQGLPTLAPGVRVPGTTAPPKLKLTIFSPTIPSMSNASQWKDNPTAGQLFILKKHQKNIRPKLLGLAATLNPRASSLFNLSIQISIFFNL